MKLFIQLGILSATNIGLSFFFQWYVLTQLGPGAYTDALFAGMAMPQLVLAVISGSLMHVLVPLLSGESEDRIRHDAWGFLALIGGLFGLLAFLLYAAAPWWVPLTVPGFDEAGQALTVELTRIQLVGMVFTAINGVQWAAYHARQQFLWAEFTPILASVFALLLLVWALPRFGVIAAAWISTLRMGLQTLLLAPGMGSPVRPDLKSPAIREAWRRIKPLLLGTAYYKTDPLVDRFLLSSAGSGSLSLYYLAQQIYGAVSQVINKAISTPLVPALSRLDKAGDKAGFRRIYHRKLLQVGAFSLAGLLILGLFGQPLLALLAGYGKLSNQNLKLLWLMMLLMSGQFAIGNLGMIMTSMFYSLGDTKSPTAVGMVAYSLGVVIKILMFYVMGALGLAMGVSIYFLISWALMTKKISEKKYV
ncbi:MAG: oligosaccharide flippase family protein [Candidatus Kuenenia sp.]|uniref:Putative peptidoglycan biosynthesis protein MurJ n=1 Tax=Kuenenia stuttgartiensis TaxID=174633 RepID=A0A2C9CCP0_KUEST|nr:MULTISPECIES: lipid II flippase MurJ [Kuenenia]MCZ7622142.1 oligosaccharide flippase family protein [Candidatus Kuenenia sp.]SOH03415.1 putative peptidoglycan biosynthesis protein MurJ [Candidatus Kuenenia stuttgartiensis]